MRGGLPVLAEVSCPPAGDRPWSLGRDDLAQLERVRERVDGARVLLVTGADGPAQATAIGLAGAAAAGGSRTALVECDLGHPTLAAELGLAPAPGLHEYLRWEAAPAEILQALALGRSRLGRRRRAARLHRRRAPGEGPGDAARAAELPPHERQAAQGLRPRRPRRAAARRAGAGAGRREADAVLAGIAPEQAGRRGRRELRSRLRRLGPTPLGAVVVQRS